MNKKELIDFEEKIQNLYTQKKIRAPIHLSSNNEEYLIELFKNIPKEDWVFSTYRNHYHALLHGISPEKLEEKIVSGNSMHIMDNNPKFYSSSIVAGHLPIALGVSMALKRNGSKNKVWAFCGDMTAESGVFHEVSKYAINHDLPINFIIEDNGLSVYTPTKDVWGNKILGLDYNLNSDKYSCPKILRYVYQRKWPHHGTGLWVDFPEDSKKNSQMITYRQELKKAMEILDKETNTVFIGQTVGYKGSPVYDSLEGVRLEKRIELPVIEEVQMGISTGMALEGYIPVSIYPRFDFLTLATNQLVNHLDKTEELSDGIFQPKVIIRTIIGSKSPLNPGPQHYQDHTEAYKLMLTNIDVSKLKTTEDIIPSYTQALKKNKSSLIVELADLY